MCRTEENADSVNDLVLSQEYTPQTHRTVHGISRETGIRLRCYEITNMEFGSCLLLEHNVMYYFVANLTDFPAVNEF